MTNYEKWLSYTSGLSSPQNYIDWGWYYLIAAALQRRVWISSPQKPCFANMYVILVGQPAIGKGLLIRCVDDCLRYLKREDIKPDFSRFQKPEHKVAVEATIEADLQEATKNEFQGKSKGADILKPLLFPIAADATTYEALVLAVGESFRRIQYIEIDEKTQQEALRTYGHSSLCFTLQELASLLRQRTHDTVNYLLGIYDCPNDYEYRTLSRGKDRVRRGCLNLLAGTTPSFMQSTFTDKLVGEGFTSRVFYIFAAKNRKNHFFVPALTDEQKYYQMEIIQHLGKLSMLYGAVKVSQETIDFLERWWDEQENNKHLRINKAIQLIPFYGRMNIHIMKIAMAIHFGESTEMEIPLSTFKKAIAIIQKEEKNMHLAVILESNNPEAKAAKRILEFLGTGKKSYVEIVTETFHLLDTKGINNALSFLQDTNQISLEQEEDTDTQQTTMYYKLK